MFRYRFMFRLSVEFIVMLLVIGSFRTAGQLRAAPQVKVVSATTARGVEGGKAIGVTNRFRRNEKTWYCVARFNRAARTKVRFDWIAVDARGTRANTIFAQRTIGPLKTSMAHSWVKLSRGNWPAGKYQVKIYLNDKFARAVSFAVT